MKIYIDALCGLVFDLHTGVQSRFDLVLCSHTHTHIVDTLYQNDSTKYFKNIYIRQHA